MWQCNNCQKRGGFALLGWGFIECSGCKSTHFVKPDGSIILCQTVEQQPTQKVEPFSDNDDPFINGITENQKKKVFVLENNLGIRHDKTLSYIKKKYGSSSLNDLSKKEASELIKLLISKAG